jgi:hypothetical protein
LRLNQKKMLKTIREIPLLLYLILGAVVLVFIFYSTQSRTRAIERDPHQNPDHRNISFHWLPPTARTAMLLGTVRVHAGAQNFDLNVTPETPAPDLHMESVLCTPASDPEKCDIVYLSQGSRATVSVQLQSSGNTVTVDVQTNRPFFSALHVDWWPASTKPIPLRVPYYSGTLAYLSAASLFASAYFDWTRSNATILNAFPDPAPSHGTSPPPSPLLSDRAAYLQQTNGKTNPLRERLVMQLSDNLQDVLPSIPNPPSPYIGQLSGRTVLDIWGPAFEEIANGLKMLGEHGLNHCVAIIHTWQRSGYDNALPAHYPADPSLGGPVLKQAVEAGKDYGCLVGLHENYVDYYPNYDHFTPDAIARTSQNQLALGWLNTTTGIQSYATKPTEMTGFASTQSPLIHRTYGTNADFLDVNSSILPWLRVDMDAKVQGAGTFSTFRSAAEKLFAYERETHQGPVFGEGLDHWLWSGYLDGVEAALGAGIPRNTGAGIPLFVDFDLLRIHPLQVNHGMGYYSTWLTPGDTMGNTASSDAYRMQEVAFGHAPFAASSFWNSPARVLLEQNLVSPVAQRYGAQTVTNIQYRLHGKWSSSSDAAKAGMFSQVLVEYSNGDKVIANGGSDNLAWNTIQIPPYGWVAQGDHLIAYTALKNGQIVDYAETDHSFFANARNQRDWLQSGDVADVSVVGVRQTAPRTLQLTLAWKALERVANGTPRAFLHFVSTVSGTSPDSIAFAADQALAVPATAWRPGKTVVNAPLSITIPDNVPDGTYSMLGGLYKPGTGITYQLAGQDRGSRRYILGNLKISNSGQSLEFAAQAAAPVSPDPRLNNTGSLIDFGPVQTDGMVSLVRDRTKWRLYAYPSYRNVTVRLQGSRIALPTRVVCNTSPVSVQRPALVEGYWQIATLGSSSCSW